MARVDVIDDQKVIVNDPTVSISCPLKAVTERVKCSINDRDVLNHSQMSHYFSVIDLYQKDKTEDEALHFFYDEPKDSTTDDMLIVKAENVMENISRNKRLMETKKDKYVFYEAKSHFIYPKSPIPLVQSDRFSIEVGLDSSRMFTPVDKTTLLGQQYYL